MSTKRRFHTFPEDQPTAARRAVAVAVQYYLDEYEDVLRFIKSGVIGDEFGAYLGRFLGRPELTDIHINLHSVDACLLSCEEIHIDPAGQPGRFRVELAQENAPVQEFFSRDPAVAAACCLVAQRQEEIYCAWLLNPDGGYRLDAPTFVPTPCIPRRASGSTQPTEPTQ